MDQPAAIQITDASVAARVDDEIMRATTKDWRKVAMIVGITMQTFRGIKDLEIADRVKLLVSSGRLEAQGDLEQMRYSEVRLPLK